LLNSGNLIFLVKGDQREGPRQDNSLIGITLNIDPSTVAMGDPHIPHGHRDVGLFENVTHDLPGHNRPLWPYGAAWAQNPYRSYSVGEKHGHQ